MGIMRTLSRRAHPERWAELTRFRRIRRLTQRSLRAQERGDLAESARLATILRRLAPRVWREPQAIGEAVEIESPEILQKASSRSEDGKKEVANEED